MYDVKIHPKIDEIPPEQWNLLVRDNNPLVRHEFLQAMEIHQCVGEKFGWIPCHIAVYREDELAAAMPLYAKYNSYGEFVFDQSWADAYSRSAMQYYPKLVSAVPYTPARGQRMLCRKGEESDYFPLLLKTVMLLLEQQEFSSFHCLFPDDREQGFFEQHELMVRHDCQFHWFNQGYAYFSDFTDRLTSRKRKNIRREREAVTKAGVNLRRLNGYNATAKDWDDLSVFYARTFEEKWGMATFNRDFFADIGKRLPANILLVMADLDGECIAGSLMYASDTTLYGRHWGCTQQIDQLHFEVCYYQGIEHCIENGLQCFEPGAQGEHKIARGFVPVLTRSSHWLADEALRKPVANFCEHEREAVAAYMLQLKQRSPYKK